MLESGTTKGTRLVGAALCGVLLLALAAPASAEIYRWVDDQGNVHFSSTPQPEASQRERQVYDRSGMQRETLPPPPTREERAQVAAEREEAERELAAAQQAREDQALRVQQLRRAYESLEDIDLLRERRVTTIRGNIQRSEGQETILLRERERIQRQKESRPNNEQLQARYALEIEELDERLERQRSYRRGQEQQLQAIEERLELDRRDFRELVMNGEG